MSGILDPSLLDMTANLGNVGADISGVSGSLGSSLGALGSASDLSSLASSLDTGSLFGSSLSSASSSLGSSLSGTSDLGSLFGSSVATSSLTPPSFFSSLWSGIKTAGSSLANDVSGLFNSPTVAQIGTGLAVQKVSSMLGTPSPSASSPQVQVSGPANGSSVTVSGQTSTGQAITAIGRDSQGRVVYSLGNGYYGVWGGNSWIPYNPNTTGLGGQGLSALYPGQSVTGTNVASASPFPVSNASQPITTGAGSNMTMVLLFGGAAIAGMMFLGKKK